MTGVRPLITVATTVRMAPAEFGIITPMNPCSKASTFRDRISDRSSAFL